MSRKSIQKAQWLETISDPVLFATNVLGTQLWEREIEILRSIQIHTRTAIKACHGVGKTFTLALAALWWLVRWADGIVLTTAPTFRQVGTQLWAEIHRAAGRSKIQFPDFNQTSMKLRGENNFALGLATNRAENFQGYHGGHILILADEAPGIESGIWAAIDGVMAGGQPHVVMAGNPTIPSGAFYDAFNSERALWNCITMDAFDTPNLRGLTLEDLLQMETNEGGPLDQNPIPYLATRRWVRDMRSKLWHGDEDSSPSWMARVRGEFPSQAQNSLMKLIWLERAKDRAEKTPVRDTGERLVAGVDVGGGEAETVVYLCQNTSTKKVLKFGAWRARDTLDEVARFLDPYLQRLTTVRVDAIGIGHNFGLFLQKKGFPVDLVNVAVPCENKPELREQNPNSRFTNEKARFYQNLADAFERDEIDGLTDDETIGQLAGIRYEVDGRGRIKIEPKERARARGVPSPDRAEALMLALGEAPRLYEFISIRDFERPKLRGQAARDAYEDQMNDYRRFGLGTSRRWPKRGCY
jgi:hypothetical protein